MLTGSLSACWCALAGLTRVLQEKGSSLMKHAPTIQLRKILVSAAAVLCCAIGLLAGGAPARAVESQDKTFAASCRISTVSVLGMGKHTAASAACAPALNKYDRLRGYLARAAGRPALLMILQPARFGRLCNPLVPRGCPPALLNLLLP